MYKIGSHIKKINIIIKYGAVSYFVSFIAMIILMYGASLHQPQQNSDAIIVLGAGLVRGDKISLTLQTRLDKAYDYATENKNSIIVVSGGQGHDETVSEAFAMKEYLLKKGIPDNRIIMEDKSTNTKENFLFSKILLDEIFRDKEYSVVYVTNEFHIFRSGIYAKRAGFIAEGLSCDSPTYLLPKFYFREYFAIIATLFR